MPIARFTLLLCMLGQASAALALSGEDVYLLAKSSVVAVLVLDKADKAVSFGSGVIVAQDRIATNCHVIDGGATVFAEIGEELLPASKVSRAARQDLCLLRAPTGSIPPARLRRIQGLRVGEQVYAIGNPQGLRHTLTPGLISQLWEVEGRPVIQTSAPISPGSSGGGLFDAEARLVGITTRMSREDSQNLNFAMPVDWIADTVANAVVPHEQQIAQLESAVRRKQAELDEQRRRLEEIRSRDQADQQRRAASAQETARLTQDLEREKALREQAEEAQQRSEAALAALRAEVERLQMGQGSRSSGSMDEALPPIGRGYLLSEAQLRYCLAESVRVDAVRSVLNKRDASSVEEFNQRVADFNSRCGAYRYASDTMASVQRDVEAHRKDLIAQARDAYRAHLGMGIPSPAKQAEGATEDELGRWRAVLHDRIKSKLVVPPGTPSDASAVYRLRLLSGGWIVAVEQEKSSGATSYDESIERAIYRSEPFPLPRDERLLASLRDVRLVFRAEPTTLDDAERVVIDAPTPGEAAPIHGATDLGSVKEAYVAQCQREIGKQVVSADYPRLARERGWEGRAVVRISFGADTAVREAVLQQSTGYAVLDDRAMEIVRRAEFPPLPPELRGTGFTVSFPVKFTLSRRVPR